MRVAIALVRCVGTRSRLLSGGVVSCKACSSVACGILWSLSGNMSEVRQTLGQLAAVNHVE